MSVTLQEAIRLHRSRAQSCLMLDMSTEWGRIDEAGMVFVKTADGEREVGSWQAGDAEAGLAYYTRRFDDRQTEITLLAKRLERGRFVWPRSEGEAVTITAAQLGYLLEGIDWRLPQRSRRRGDATRRLRRTVIIAGHRAIATMAR